MGDVTGRRRLARWLLGLEALGLSGLTLYVVARDFGDDISNHGLLSFLAGVMTLVSALLWAGSIAIPRGARWPQAPIMFLQISMLLSSIALFQAGRVALGIPIVIIAAVSAVTIVGIRAEDANPQAR